jgi:hypothetical protein
LQLSSYDGIIGLDWLGKYSPMVTDWKQGWISIPHNGRQVVLHSGSMIHFTHALVELNLVNNLCEDKHLILADVQVILNKFTSVFMLSWIYRPGDSTTTTFPSYQVPGQFPSGHTVWH